MKKILSITAIAAVVATALFTAYKLYVAYKLADIISDEAAEDTRLRFMTGAYADFREVSADDMEIFNSAYTGSLTLHPQSVSTQVVAGTNYRFICTDDSDAEVMLTVFKPLPGRGEPAISGIEPISAYNEIVLFLERGFKDSWQESTPEDMGLSQVYCYCSPSMGSARIDINRDGVIELVIGETYDNGHTIYDIFTYDAETGSVQHLASGGERDRYCIDNDGTIFREGSNSAFDSFTKSYRIEGCSLVETKTAQIEGNLMDIEFTPFI